MDRTLERVHVVCDSYACHSRQILRSFPGGRHGICAGQRWYCSVDCFVQAASTTLFALSNRQVVEMPRTPRLSLGLVMLSKGYLTAEQLRTATRDNQWRDEDLDSTLIRLGMATEKQIATARSAQWGYPVLAQEHFGRMVETDLPRALLASCSAAPLHYSQAAKRILLGFVVRVEYSLLQAIEQMTGCRVDPCFITATDLAEQNERLTQISGHKEIPVEDPGSPEKMARSLGRAAVDIEAANVEFTRCRNDIWVRLSGRRGIADVIFRMKNVLGDAFMAQSDVLVESGASLG